MDNTPRVPAPMLRERREQTIQRLIEHFADDRITVEELEQRLDLAHRATDEAGLTELLADLPAVPAPPPEPAPERPRAPAPQPHRRLPSEVHPRDRQLLVAVMGGVSRSGSWVPARHTMVLAVMGGAELDFREAALGPGVTEISIFSFWGGVEIIVPPDVHVDTGGVAIMGGFEAMPTAPAPRDPEAPVLRINGVAIMAGVEIHVRYPGETAKDAKLRVKDERKRLAEERKRLAAERKRLGGGRT
jgi:hypothetical protein